MKKKLISAIVASITIIVLVLQFNMLLDEQNQVIEKNARLSATHELSDLSTKVQTVLNVSLQYAEFFEVLINNNPDIEASVIKDYAEFILENNAAIHSVSVAPDGIVKHVFPIEGNEAAIGHDLLNDPERSEYLTKAIETRQPVAQGPVVSKQGNLLIFNRCPIFLGNNSESFWGFASVAIDFQIFLELYDIVSSSDAYLYAIRVRESNSKEDFLWGYPEIILEDSIASEVELPGEVWEIFIMPRDGWTGEDGSFQGFIGLFYLLMALIFVLVFAYVNHYFDIMDKSKTDSLTGALNHKTFKRKVEKKLDDGRAHGMIVIDIDDFKEINDTYGHPVGDEVLKIISERIRNLLRPTDMFSRIGGDEFVVFVEDVKLENDIYNIESRIHDVLGKHFRATAETLEVKCSSGIALSGTDGSTYESLYMVADKRMYASKQSKQQWKKT